MALSITVLIIYSLCFIQGSLSAVIAIQGVQLCNSRSPCSNKILRCNPNPSQPSQSGCTVHCLLESSCDNTVIEKAPEAPESTEITVFCHANACSNIIIKDAIEVVATTSGSLNNAEIHLKKRSIFSSVLRCQGYQSCDNIDLFCPPPSHTQPNAKFCAVFGDGNDNNNNLRIHTLYGVSELSINDYKDEIKLYCNLGLAECDIEFEGNEFRCNLGLAECQKDRSSNDGIIVMGAKEHQRCTNDDECRNKAIICLRERCWLYCDDEYSCHNSRIANYYEYQRDEYRRRDWVVYCNAQNSCSNSIIYGATHVNGLDEYALDNTQIYCHKEEECKIVCDGKMSCNDATFHGKLSKKLTIECNSEENTCNNMNVYCPDRSDQSNCGILGSSNDKHNTVNVYAHGTIPVRMKRLFIDNGYKENTQIIGNENKMHSYASTHYQSSSCVMSSVFGVCVTNSPTVNPTQMPSAITISPTISPTQMPTIPTNNPTNMPTQTPTSPTVSPTQSPTLPTNYPTLNPTTMPTDNTINNHITVTIIMGCIIAVIIV